MLHPKEMLKHQKLNTWPKMTAGVQKQWVDEQIAKDTVSVFDNPKDLAAQTLLIYTFGLLNKFISFFFKKDFTKKLIDFSFFKSLPMTMTLFEEKIYDKCWCLIVTLWFVATNLCMDLKPGSHYTTLHDFWRLRRHDSPSPKSRWVTNLLGDWA